MNQSHTNRRNKTEIGRELKDCIERGLRIELLVNAIIVRSVDERVSHHLTSERNEQQDEINFVGQ